MDVKLFVDVLAWIWGVLLTAVFFRSSHKYLFNRDDYGSWGDPVGILVLLAICAAFCWAWIIAG